MSRLTPGVQRTPPVRMLGGTVTADVRDAWDPDRYRRFAGERSAPFWDLLDLVRPVPGGRVVDLGCGSGELTAELHRALAAAETLGLDSSAAMLARARPRL